jgi:hypothetical protein
MCTRPGIEAETEVAFERWPLQRKARPDDRREAAKY